MSRKKKAIELTEEQKAKNAVIMASLAVEKERLKQETLALQQATGRYQYPSKAAREARKSLEQAAKVAEQQGEEDEDSETE